MNRFKIITYSVLLLLLFLSVLIIVKFFQQRTGLIPEVYKVDTGSFYGLHADFQGPVLLKHGSRLAKLISDVEIRYVRMACPWNEVESEKGIFKWNRCDSGVEVLNDAGIEPLVRITLVPQWAALDEPVIEECATKVGLDPIEWRKSHGPPKDMMDWRNYIRKIVERYGYGSGGRRLVRYWEIWNEPDTKFFFCGKPWHYFQMLKVASQIIKEVDPNAVVLFGGISNSCLYKNEAEEWLRKVLERENIDQYFDIFNIHIYGVWQKDPGVAVEKFKSILKDYGLENKPIWVTETNSRSGSEEKTAKELEEWYQRLRESGVEKVFFFKLRNNPDDKNTLSYGFFKDADRDFQKPTKVYDAFKKMVGGSKPTPSSIPSSTPVSSPEPTPSGFSPTASPRLTSPTPVQKPEFFISTPDLVSTPIATLIPESSKTPVASWEPTAPTDTSEQPPIKSICWYDYNNNGRIDLRDLFGLLKELNKDNLSDFFKIIRNLGVSCR